MQCFEKDSHETQVPDTMRILDCSMFHVQGKRIVTLGKSELSDLPPGFMIGF